MSSPLQDQEYKYWAFISYSHADQKAADKLHHNLETYGVPKVLVGKPSKVGVVPKRAYPVFRDRDELPSSADLGDRLTDALRQSRYLIVICSPRAVASRWVNEEIKTFKSMGREDKVLCLVIDGEPYASDHPELGLEECFPEPVRYRVDAYKRITGERTEPIAADARKGKDGWHNAKLKLLAGMFGVNFSDLRQRDQERKTRRDRTILVAVGCLALVLTYLVFMVVQQKNEAEKAKLDALQQMDIAKAEREKAIRSELAARDAAKSETAAREQEKQERIKAEKSRQDADDARVRAEQAQREAQASEHQALEAKKLEAAAKEAAEKALKDAEKSENKATRALSVSDFNEAARLITEGNEPRALAYLSRSLRLDGRNTAVQARVISLLSDLSWPVAVAPPMGLSGPGQLVVFSPDGSRVLTAAGNIAQLWNSKTGQPEGPAFAHKGPVRSAAFSPDGKRLVTAGDDRQVRLWDLTTGQPIGKPMSHGDWVYTAVFSPDGSKILTASQDKTARLWNATTGEPASDPLPHANRVTAAAFSPDGKRFVTVVDGLVRLWDADGAKLVSETIKHDGGVFTVVFSPDGRFLATASGDRTARVWDAATGNPVTDSLKHDGVVTSAIFSPDGRWLLTASKDRTARLWDAQSGQLRGEPLRHTAEVSTLAFSPNALSMVTGTEDGVVRTWRVSNLASLAQDIHLGGAVRSLAFSPDGRTLAMALADRTAQLWSVLAGQPQQAVFRHDQGVNDAAFSPDGKRVATASSDRSARVWDVSTGQPVTSPFRHDNRVTGVQFSPDGRYVLTISEDRVVRVWDVAADKLLQDKIRHDSSIRTAVFSPDGSKILTASDDTSARIWETATGNLVGRPLAHDRAVASAIFSQDGTKVVTASADRTARVWDVKTGQIVAGPFKHDGELRAVAISKDGAWVATASEDRSARVWDVVTGKLVAGPLRHDAAVNDVCFSPDMTRLVSVSEDRTARVWELPSGKPVTDPLVHEGEVKKASFSRDGYLLLTVSREKRARVWNAASWKPVNERLTHASLIRGANLSPDGQFVVTASDDNTARLWLISLPGRAPSWLPELAEAVGGFRLAEAGGAEPVTDAWSTYQDIRGVLAGSGEGDAFTRWAGWFLADRSARTIAPYSKVSVADFVRQRIDDGTTNALNEALEIQPDNGTALAKLAEKYSTDTNLLFQADYFSRQAVSVDAKTPDIQWIRSLVLQRLGRIDDAFAAMQKALEVDPKNVNGMGPEGRVIDTRNRDGLASQGWVPKGWGDGNAKMSLAVKYTKLEDPPIPEVSAMRLQVTSGDRGPATLIGPRFIVRSKGRYAVEGWVRSTNRSDLTVSMRQFMEPYERYAEQVVRTTTEWKKFRVQLSAINDLSGEVWFQIPVDGSVDIAGVSVRPE